MQRVVALSDEQRFSDWAQLLLDQATLAERGSLKDPAQFVTRFNRLMLELTDAE